jgi:phosphate transport system permease protein
MGEVANGSQHYQVLFFIGIVLFVVSFIVNLAASAVSLRSKKRSDKMLS